MSQAVCPLCGAIDSTYAFSERGYDLLCCSDCDLFYIDPYERAETYERVADYDYQDLKIVGLEKHYAGSAHFLDQYYSRIRSHCDSASSILDVGCGTGRLLEALGRDTDAECTGLELNRARAAFARRVARCSVHETPLEEFSPEGTFDAVLLMNVLSHIPSFDAVFLSARRLLTPAGRLILKVCEYDRRVSKSAVNDWSLPDHLHFLGLRTLTEICERYGFEVIEHSRIPLAAELFDKRRWRIRGRSWRRDFLKQAVSRTPLALRVMRRLYSLRHGGDLYSSFVVLAPRQSPRAAE